MRGWNVDKEKERGGKGPSEPKREWGLQGWLALSFKGMSERERESESEAERIQISRLTPTVVVYCFLASSCWLVGWLGAKTHRVNPHVAPLQCSSNKPACQHSFRTWYSLLLLLRLCYYRYHYDSWMKPTCRPRVYTSDQRHQHCAGNSTHRPQNRNSIEHEWWASVATW